MRAWALPVALILLAAAVAGCVNDGKTDGGVIDPAKQNGGGSGGSGSVGTGLGASVAPLLPLGITATGPSGKWLAPGSTVQVSASAAGAVSYVWSIGALPGTVAAPAVKLDTGSAKDGSDWIAPGQTKSLVYGTAGVFQMHCHPHPFMLANVTVVDGYAGPKEVHVQIVDAGDLQSYRFVPENIVIGKGTTVVYHNNGTQPHTATLMKAEPALKKLDLSAASGQVAVSGDGWQRIRVVAVDNAGRLGVADIPVYVKPLPVYNAEPWTVSFQAGGLPEEAVKSESKSFMLDHNASLNVTWAFKDAVAANGGPVNNAQVDIHVFPMGSEQDVITSEAKPEGAGLAKVQAGTYTVKVVPKQGVGLAGTITVSALFEDPAPPAPVMAGAGGDAHSGHAH